ncbi:MAG: ATPase P [Peptococcaceae bacterium]|nr:ATPase P [Peptococcaceae bacterium]
MISVKIPGPGLMNLKHIVLDFNGTMATDGVLAPGVQEKLNRLAPDLEVHILTADTFGTVKEACRMINGTVTVLGQGAGAPEKEKFVRRLGEQNVVAVGNGMNDRLMLKTAALGILVLGSEGACSQAITAADIVVRNILDGLDLLLNPKRIIATLRW